MQHSDNRAFCGVLNNDPVSPLVASQGSGELVAVRVGGKLFQRTTHQAIVSGTQTLLCNPRERVCDVEAHRLCRRDEGVALYTGGVYVGTVEPLIVGSWDDV